MHVSDPRVAAAFTNPKLRRLLMWFVGGPKSAGEAALALGMDLKRTHYHVRRLYDLGLVKVAAERRRAGRPVKLYRAVSDAFFIPHDVAPKGFGEELALELRESLARDLSRREGGLLLTSAKNGSPRGRMVAGRSGSAPPGEMWRVLRLNAKDAASLKRELNAVLNRYQRNAGGSGKVFLAHAALVPRLAFEGVVDNDLIIAQAQ